MLQKQVLQQHPQGDTGDSILQHNSQSPFDNTATVSDMLPAPEDVTDQSLVAICL